MRSLRTAWRALPFLRLVTTSFMASVAIIICANVTRLMSIGAVLLVSLGGIKTRRARQPFCVVVIGVLLVVDRILVLAQLAHGQLLMIGAYRK